FVSGYFCGVNLRLIFIIISVGFVLVIGCRKERFIEKNGAALEFSTDTVYFDTVFSAVGSATRRLLIRNPHKESIKIEQIQLAGGENSVFRLNIDGNPTNSLKELVIKGNDSAFVFVEV